MQAIIPNRPARSRSYAWASISLEPDPPSVGEVCRITFPLLNPGPDDLAVERIETRVALFGIGVRWEPLPAIGPFMLPADDRAVERVSVEWTPREGGHRCVRAAIHMLGTPHVCEVGRNLHVIEADARDEFWRVPFYLGNPEARAAPIELRIGGNEPAALDAWVRVRGEMVRPDHAVWMDAGEQAEAELLIRARTDAPLRHVRLVEALIRGRLLDGIQVTVSRPPHAGDGSLPAAPGDALHAREELTPLRAVRA